MRDASKSGGGEDDGRRQCATQEGGAGIDARNITKNAGDEFVSLIRITVVEKAGFIFCSAIDVIEDAARKTSLRNEAKVIDVGGTIKPTFAG
jgi:hypothetical protein